MLDSVGWTHAMVGDMAVPDVVSAENPIHTLWPALSGTGAHNAGYAMMSHRAECPLIDPFRIVFRKTCGGRGR